MPIRRKPCERKAVSISLASQVYELIKHDVITCQLPPGLQIAQPQLADRYQVGTTPIREALQRLAREGLVQAVPRFGYLVTSITLSDVTEIFESRSILESAAARLAALHASDEQLAQIVSMADFTYTYRDLGSYTGFLAHNATFHQRIATACGNRRLSEWISQTLNELTRVFHLGLDLRDSAEEMREEHVALAKALSRRDPTRAERIVRAQIATSQQRILDSLLPSSGGTASGTLGQTVRLKPS